MLGRDPRELFSKDGLIDELKKAMLTGRSKVTLAVPRDRAGTFDPKLIAKYQRRFPDFDDKIISMYAPGTRSIVAQHMGTTRHGHRIYTRIIGSRRLGDRRFASSVTNWLNQRAQAREARLGRDFLHQHELYKDFILAASAAYGEAVVSSKPQIQELIALYAMISRMRVVSSPQTVTCAEKIMVVTLGIYSMPNMSAPELRELFKSGAGIDPLKELAAAAREELHKHPARSR